ncbi:MAG: hypothetical protein ACP5U2_13930, partial [Bryobacteraceae bacterium]
MRGMRLAAGLTFLLLLAVRAQSQVLVCRASSVSAPMRLEGLAEPAGEIVLSCSGGTPLSAVTINLTLLAPVNITNRLMGPDTLDVKLDVNAGSGFVPAGVAALWMPPAGVAFNGLSFQLSASGAATLRIGNLRLAAGQFPSSLAGQPVRISIASGGQGPLAVDIPQVVVGNLSHGLLAATSTLQILCTGSRLPDTPTFSNLIAAGTRFASTRLTEGSADAFRPKGPNDDTGTRFLVQYSGFPPGARLFVPEVVAGSSAIEPTAGGDLGLPPSSGKYAPAATGSLLLARVAGADSGGAGGRPVYRPGPPGSGVVSFDAVSEVPLSGGAGFVVYEVMDASPLLRE